MVESKKFYTFYLTKEMVVESMKNAGLKDIEIDLASSHGSLTTTEMEGLQENADFSDLFFTYGRA
jgi:hypothetical protein